MLFAKYRKYIYSLVVIFALLIIMFSIFEVVSLNNEIDAIHSDYKSLLETNILLEDDIEALKNENKKSLDEFVLFLENDRAKKEAEYWAFRDVINKAIEFAIAHKSNEFENINKLLSSNIELSFVGDTVYVKHYFDGNETKVPLSHNSNFSIESFSINGFGIYNDKLVVNLWEQVVDENGNGTSPPTFIELIFIFENEQWLIYSIANDA